MANPEIDSLDVDYLIVGAGIAGASVAYWLAPHGKVVILEREAHPGVHSTGRSAAVYFESYGTPQVRMLTRASRPFLEHPPAGFAEHPVLSPLGTLFVATADQLPLLDDHEAMVKAVNGHTQRLTVQQACARFPALRPDVIAGAIHEEDALAMDVDVLHQGYLRGAARAGARVIPNAEVLGMTRDTDGWQVNAGGRTLRARVVINAAGAWADVVAGRAGVTPIGLQPRRRSAFVFEPPAGTSIAGWPMLVAIDESFYIKPDAGLLLGSPANADPVDPHDVQPEELDIAIGIDRIQAFTTLTIRRPKRTWAGLRSFVADGDLVGGWDDRIPGFFWVAAQGGYGIQTSAAMGEACAAMARGLGLPPSIAAFGLTEAMLGPARLRRLSG